MGSPVDSLLSSWLACAPRDRATDFVVLPMGSKATSADVVVNEVLVRNRSIIAHVQKSVCQCMQ